MGRGVVDEVKERILLSGAPSTDGAFGKGKERS
jgi:hypothetical protein